MDTQDTHDIQAILKRNKHVEADKAWETSMTRRLCIFLITYLAAAFFFRVNELPKPFVQGFIPAGAYLLSTITLPPIQKWWLRSVRKD